MIERKWTKFKDNIPSQNEAAFVTDWVSVWVISPSPMCSWQAKITDCSEYGWSPIELPEVPKEEKKHCCQNEGILCIQTEVGLWLCNGRYENSGIIFIPPKVSLNSLEVKFCPFCGYEAKNK